MTKATHAHIRQIFLLFLNRFRRHKMQLAPLDAKKVKQQNSNFVRMSFDIKMTTIGIQSKQVSKEVARTKYYLAHLLIQLSDHMAQSLPPI